MSSGGSFPSDLSHIDVNSLIHRELLDFDHEMRCSVTLSESNLFLCLTCGKIFSGGEDNSPIIQHFFSDMHPLCLRLHDNSLVLLPDYQKVPSTNDVYDVLFTAHPHYDEKILSYMHEKMKKVPICPGSYEIHTLVNSSARISVLRFVACIEPLRDYLLLNNFKKKVASAFSEFFKHYFNPYYFKNAVSADKLIHALPDVKDPFSYLSYILNCLSKEFGPNNVLEKNLRGRMKIEAEDTDNQEWNTLEKDIWMIPLELQDSPLYRSGLEKEKIIPSSELKELLKRYDGETIIENNIGGTVERVKYHLCSAPRYIIINTNRIKYNGYYWEKNNLHIDLPNDEIDLTEYGSPGKYSLRAIISHKDSVEDGEYITFFYNRDADTWIKCSEDGISASLLEFAKLPHCCFILFEKTS